MQQVGTTAQLQTEWRDCNLWCNLQCKTIPNSRLNEEVLLSHKPPASGAQHPSPLFPSGNLWHDSSLDFLHMDAFLIILHKRASTQRWEGDLRGLHGYSCLIFF